jgi:transcriptional regulator with XRE-family HTH domain
MTIGKRIKAKREELGLSQRDLAEKMHYTNHSTIGKIERGQVDVSQARITQFAEVLGTTVAYLMGWEENKNTAIYDDSSISGVKRNLLDLVSNCSDEEASRLLQMMELFLQKK